MPTTDSRVDAYIAKPAEFARPVLPHLRGPVHRACPQTEETLKLNEAGTKPPPRPKQTEKKELVVPAFFAAALKKNKKALATFEAYSYSHKREYVQWVAEAKREETRQRRLATALARLAKGKGSSPHSGSE